MREDELLTLIAQGEGATLEFKSGSVSADKLAKEIVAFANLGGGSILLGVEDDGSVNNGWADRTRNKTEEWLMDTVIGGHIRPRIIPKYEEILLDNKRIGVISVPTGTAKPYVVCYNMREDFYIRIGNICRRATREQIMRMMETTSPGIIEKLPVYGGGDYRHELNMELVKNYFFDVVGYDKADDIGTLLKNRDFLVLPEHQNEWCCSYIAYIMFAQSPLRRLPQAGIRLLVYKSEDVEYNAVLDEILDAPFLGCGSRSKTLPNIFDLTMEYLRPHISQEKLSQNKTTRERKWDYLREVVRELLINAFAHRDWTRSNQIKVVVYSNRMEIESPGALPNGMTVEKIKSGQQTNTA